MRALILAVVVALVAMPAGAVEVTTGNNVIVSRGSTATGPRILGEPAFAFELDALTQAEASRPGWPVTTTRASTRMCWTGSAWQTVPENTPCIGVSGLASFGPGTNYWANSTEPEKWVATAGATVAGNVVTDNSDVAFAGVRVSLGTSVGLVSSWTVTCEAASGTLDRARLRIITDGSGGAVCTGVQLHESPSRVSCSGSVSGSPTYVQAFIEPGLTHTDTGSIVVHQCQLEKSPTPGPRHDCEAAPCSWQADVHTVSTAGWPVAAGEVRLQYTPLNATSASVRYLLDTRTSGTGGDGVGISINPNGSMGLVFRGGGVSSDFGSSTLTWVGCDPTITTCVPYTISLRWDDERAVVSRDGAVVIDAPFSAVPTAHRSDARLGSNIAGALQANGSIRLLRVSQ